MASDLMDLMQQTIQQQGPTYAENRFTRAPMILNAAHGAYPDEAYTEFAQGHSGLSELLDKLSVIPARIRAGLSPVHASPTIGIGPVSTGADPADLRDTFRHETIHSALDKAGMTDEDFHNIYRNSTAGQKLLQVFNKAGRAGEGIREVPAYVRGDAKLLPGAMPQDIQQFRSDVSNYLRHNKKDPHTADLYMKLVEP